MANSSMRRAMIVVVCALLIGIGGSCGKKTEIPDAPSSETTLSHSLTSTPTPEHIISPTPTPASVPTVDPNAAFLEWLDSNGYEYLIEGDDGSKRYEKPNSDSITVVYIYPDNLLARTHTIEEKETGPAQYEITNFAIGALESHGMDASALQKLTEEPYKLPLLMQGEKYFVLIRSEDSSSVTSRVTFLE